MIEKRCIVLVAGKECGLQLSLQGLEGGLLNVYRCGLRHRTYFVSDHEASAPLVFRRERDGDTWHVTSECSAWPAADYEEKLFTVFPPVICNECVVKRQHGKR